MNGAIIFEDWQCFLLPLTFKCAVASYNTENELCSAFANRMEFSCYWHCRYKSLSQRHKFCLHLRLLNMDGLTTEVQQQWLIKQEFNLAVSSRFNDAYHRIDSWLIIYWRFHYPAEGKLMSIQPKSLDTTTWEQGEILDLPLLIWCYSSNRLNWQGFNSTKRGNSVVLRLTCLLLSSLMSLREDSSWEVDSCFTHTIML